ncbi:amidohydrolase family protein [Dactylosporangium sp. AC04546]|uniref:amidohydrolase family protein n=1 Tax=Dactylosporangium sp. AC04546 TaxID=2862460 RepID=UPI001EE04AE0|nr:amidohydrolase family protein [Dactylosporangium sp. AC04546]WVK86522.1 amidohydrolase family protein [Dactylosporangium sp. AC04546]
MPEPGIVDCHVHVGLTKYRPVEEYRDSMRRCGIDRAVLVQYLGNADNAYLERVVQEDPEVFTGIGLVDADDPAAPRRIDELARRGVLGGVRLPARVRGDVWKAMDAHGLTASVTGPFTDVVDDTFLDVVDHHPGVHFRLEHLGWLRFADDPAPYPGFRQFLRLAERPNTSASWSGFFLNAATPYPYPDAVPYLRMCLAAFGADRLMWSGDWNRAGGTDADYAAAVVHVTDHMTFLDPDERDRVLGRSAATILGRPSWV